MSPWREVDGESLGDNDERVGRSRMVGVACSGRKVRRKKEEKYGKAEM